MRMPIMCMRRVVLCAVLGLQLAGPAAAQRAAPAAPHPVPPVPHVLTAPPGAHGKSGADIKIEQDEPEQHEDNETVAPHLSHEELVRFQVENPVLLSTIEADPDRLLMLPDDRAREVVDFYIGSARLRTLLKGTELAKFLAEENIHLADPPTALRARLVRWIAERHNRFLKEEVRALSSAEKWMLDNYIRATDPTLRPNFDNEVRHWDGWQRWRQRHLKDERGHFPAFSIAQRNQGDVFAAMPDQHEARYARQANAAYIEAHPPLARLQSEGWNFDAATPAELGRMLEMLAQPLPGGQPTLFYFIDPKSPQHDTMTDDISAAWKQRGGEPPAYLLHTNIRKFLEERRGQTVILLGHIFDTDFMLERGPDQPPLLIDIPDLLGTAAELGVWLIPIGCKSASAGSPFGFTRSIDSIEVAKFVGALPRDTIAVADVLASLGAIAPVKVNVSAFADYLELAISNKSNNEAVVVTRIPALPAAAANSATSPANYQQFTASWIEAHRPPLDRGLLRALRSAFRNTRGALPLSVAAVLALVDFALQRIRRKVDGTPRTPGTRLQLAQMHIRRLWVVLALGGLVYMLWAPWLYITLGVLLAILVLGAASVSP